MSFWDFVPKIIETGITLWGAHETASADKKARDVAIEQQNRATKAQLEGLRIAEENQRQLQTAASPGLVQMQNIIGRGEALTPEQIIALEDARRTSLDSLHGSGLRGSARATVATVNDVEGRMRAGFLDQNRNRADGAASALTGQYFNAGNNMANIATAQGGAVSSGLLANGQNLVDSIKNQNTIKGRAIGDIGAVIADSVKAAANEKRSSSYDSLNDPIHWNEPKKEIA